MGNSLGRLFKEAGEGHWMNGERSANIPDSFIPRQNGEFCEICVPFKDNALFWAVVLSYFMNLDVNLEPSPFALISTLTKDQFRKIEKLVKSHNFFQNLKCCFSDEELIRELIELPGGKETFPFQVTDNLKLIANALDCRIRIIEEFPSKDVKETSFIPDFRSESEKCFVDVTVFKRVIEENCQYSFGMATDIAVSQQRTALEIVINIINTSDGQFQHNISDVPYLQVGANLPVSLIKNKCHDLVARLFRQPPYIFERLRVASLVTDPLEDNDNNETAIYHAILSTKFEIISPLYDYSLRSPNWLMTSPRESTKQLSKNLDRLSEVLANTKSLLELNDNGEVNVDHERCFLELSAIHKFHVELNEIEENYPNQSFDCREENASETMSLEKYKLKKKKLVELLSLYFKNFYLEYSELSRWQNFEKYGNYYYYIDVLSTLTFFDHSFSLKMVLNLENEEYEPIETAFCRLLFFRYHVEQSFTEDIAFLTRVNRKFFHKQLEKGIQFLKRIKVKAIEKIPESELDVLISEPEIKDEFLLRKFSLYLDLAIGVNIEENGEDIFVLVLQRAVQVIGETVKNDKVFSPSVVKSLFMSSLCAENNKLFSDLRKKLSHFQMSLLYTKSKALDLNQFTGIQNELKQMKNMLQPIQVIQENRIHKWVYQKIKKMIHDLKLNSEEIDSLNSKCSIEIETLTMELLSYIALDEVVVVQRHLNNHKDQISKFIENDINTLEITDIKKIVSSRFGNFEQFLIFLLSEVRVLSDCKYNGPINVGSCEEILQNLEDYISSEKINIELLDEKTDDYKVKFIEICRRKLNKLVSFKKDVVEALYLETKGGTKDKYSFPNLKGFNNILSGHLSTMEKEEITDEVPQKFKDRYAAGVKLLKIITEEEENTDVDLLFNEFPEECREDLRMPFARGDEENFRIMLSTIENPFEELLNALENNNLHSNACVQLCKTFGFSDCLKTKYFENSKENDGDNAIFFFGHRVEQMKRIVFERVYLKKEKEYINDDKTVKRHKVLQHVMNDRQMLAAMEMLLFDCMNLLNWRSYLKKLWLKTDSLFRGVNLRNVLAHGNPLLDMLIFLHDPYDLVNKLVEQLLDFVDDFESIKAMGLLYGATKCKWRKFVRLVKDDSNVEHKELITQILKCAKWKEYSNLIPGFCSEKKLSGSSTGSKS